MAHGMPSGRPDPNGTRNVVFEDRTMVFSEEVTDFLLGAAA
ncbi:hypothetical protein O7A70_04740 [Mesorhizobium sp. Cs1299R1N1]